MNSLNIGDSSYYSAQRLAWQLAHLLVSLHFNKKLTVEQILVLISCYLSNFTRENGVKRLRPSSEAELKSFVSRRDVDASEIIEDLVRQSHLIKTQSGYLLNSSELMEELTRPI